MLWLHMPPPGKVTLLNSPGKLELILGPYIQNKASRRKERKYKEKRNLKVSFQRNKIINKIIVRNVEWNAMIQNSNVLMTRSVTHVYINIPLR